jgi:hypothetical protein
MESTRWATEAFLNVRAGRTDIEETRTMKFRTIAGMSAALLGAASLATFAPSAHAATTGSNTLTFQLTGAASLAIAVPSNPSAVSGSIVTGSTVPVTLGSTTVTDNTGSLLGWTVTADATDLTDGGSPAHTIAKTNMLWLTGTVTAGATGLLTGVAVGAGGAFGTLPVTVARALATTGGGSYSYPATVTLTVPANSYAATYTTTVTQTVA